VGCQPYFGMSSFPSGKGHLVQTTSWLGSVWSLRGEERLLIGQVHAVEGDVLTLAVVGLGEAPPAGVELLPRRDGSGQFARVSSGTLLGRWKRMGGGKVASPA
jgi:hypothetical protein